MRFLSVVRCAVLLGSVTALASAQPKSTGAHRRGRAVTKPADTAPDKDTPAAAPTSAPSSSDSNPYGEPDNAASSAAPAASEPAAPADGKIGDTPPPPRPDVGAGGKPSPLNPEANEFPKAAPSPGPANLDALMSDIAALRARVAALTTSLFSSKLRVYIHTDGDDAKVASFVVTLDDGTVFRGEPGFVADDEKIVYEHAVAPGAHVVGVEVERQDARGTTYRTWQVSRFSVQVPERKVLEAIVDVDDDSNMGKDFPSDQDGKYDLRIRLRAKVAE